MTTSEVLFVQKRLHTYDLLSEVFPAWDLSLVQTESGPASMNVFYVDTGRYILTRFEADRKFHYQGRTPVGFRSFAIPACEQEDLVVLGQRVQHGQVVLSPASCRVEGVGHAGLDLLSLSLCHEDIAEVWAMSGLNVSGFPVDDGGVFSPLPDDMKRLREALGSVLSLAGEGEKQRVADAVEPVKEALAAGLASSVEESGYPEPRRRDFVFKSVLKYMMGNLDTISSVKDLCEAGNVSERTLLYIFRDRLDVTPKEFLQACKLRQVRQDILSGQAQSVTDAATRWGFWHMGQFAADYRRQFGELPSVTLKRTSRT